MPKPTTQLVWREFPGEFDGVAIEAEGLQASTVQDLYRDRGALKRRKGISPLGSGALTPDQDLDGLGWFKIGSTEYLLAAHNGTLTDWLHATPGTVVTNSSGKLTNATDCGMAWVEDAVYIGDGVKQNIRFNGTRVDQAMVDNPSSAPTVAAGAAGVLTGTYIYKVTFLSADSNESEPSVASSSVSVTSQQVNLTNIPTCGAGQDCAGRRIYRTKNGGTTYYLVTTISDNSTTSYTDNTADSSLGAEIVEGNTRFPPCRYLIAHQDRLIGAHCTTSDGDKKTVYISNYAEPYYSPAAPDLDDPNQGTRITLYGPAAGEITGLASHGDKVAVFTGGACFLLTTSDQLLDYALHLFTNHGCVAHRTIKSVKDMLIWAAPDGIYMAREGQGVARISDDIKTTYQAISVSDLAKAHAFVWDDKYFFCWPSGCRVYDLRYGMWSRNTNWTWRASTVTTFTSSAAERIYGARYGSARVWRMETGTDDNGTAITAKWTSKDFDCGVPFRQKRLQWVGVVWKTASGTATVRLYKGTGTTATQTATKDLATVDATGATVTRLEQRLAEQLRDEFFRIEVEYAGAASDYQLLQVTAEWTLAT